MKISNKFYEVVIGEDDVTILSRTTFTQLRVPREELEQLFNMLGPIFENPILTDNQ